MGSGCSLSEQRRGTVYVGLRDARFKFCQLRFLTVVFSFCQELSLLANKKNRRRELTGAGALSLVVAACVKDARLNVISNDRGIDFVATWEQAYHNRGQRQRWDGRTGLLARLNHGCDLLAAHHAQHRAVDSYVVHRASFAIDEAGRPLASVSHLRSADAAPGVEVGAGDAESSDGVERAYVEEKRLLGWRRRRCWLRALDSLVTHDAFVSADEACRPQALALARILARFAQRVEETFAQ